MTEQEQAIRQFRRRLAVLLTLRRFLAYLTIGAFVYGTLALALRAALGLVIEPLLWGLLAFSTLLIPAIWRAWRSLPSSTKIRALFDEQNQCGGVLMASEERSLGRWSSALRTPHQPRVRWRCGSAWGFLTLAATFLLCTFLVPQSYFFARGSEPTLQIDQEVADLKRKIEVLKQENVIEESRAKELQQRLDQVKENSSAMDPVKTIDALDHVEDISRREAQAAAEKIRQQVEQMAKIKALARALQQQEERATSLGGKPQSAKSGAAQPSKDKEKGAGGKWNNAKKELAKMVEQASRDNRELQKRLDTRTKKELAQALHPDKRKEVEPGRNAEQRADNESSSKKNPDQGAANKQVSKSDGQKNPGAKPQGKDDPKSDKDNPQKNGTKPPTTGRPNGKDPEQPKVPDQKPQPKEGREKQPRNLDAAQLQKLAKMAESLQRESLKKLQRLQRSQLIDQQTAQEALDTSQFDARKLADLMRQNSDGKRSMEQLINQARRQPGKGDVAEGPGDAPLVFGEKTSEQKKQLKEAALPLSKLLDLKKSGRVGLGKTAPKKGDVAESLGAGEKTHNPATASAASKHVILPKHRKAVERYNDRKRPR